MTQPIDLPPSIVRNPTGVEISVFTAEGAVVQIALAKPALRALPDPELAARARTLAAAALTAAAQALAG